jgi:hypothetical protein
MQEVLMAVIFMSIVFAIAAGFLFVLDRLTLRKKVSGQERDEALEKRSRRFANGWSFFLFFDGFYQPFCSRLQSGS